MTHLEWKLDTDGVQIFPNVFSGVECDYFISLLERAHVQNLNHVSFVESASNQFVPNFFRHSEELLRLVYIPKIDEILKNVLDEDYVLVGCNAINRSAVAENKDDSIDVGSGWHTDSRYLNGTRLQAGFFFSMIVMLDDFRIENGATEFVRGSHLRTDRPLRDGNYEFSVITGTRGDVVLFDSGLWHRGGEHSEVRRWSIFNMYGPWFVKPYFDFTKMVDPLKIGPRLKALLHFNSIPPVNEYERFNTLQKIVD